MANVEIEGLALLLAKLDNFGGNMDKALQGGIDKATRRVKRDAKLLCPVDTSRLRNSIQHKTTIQDGKIEGVVSTNVEYAPYVEFGTGQRGEQAQVFRPVGISYRLDWAGQPPVPFLFPALVQNENQIKKDMINEVKKAIKEACKK